MIKRVFIGVFALILMLSLLSVSVIAATASITIETLPNHEVYVSILDYTDDDYALKIIHGKSDSEGIYQTTYDSDLSFINLRVIVKSSTDAPRRAVDEKFLETYGASENIVILALPDEVDGFHTIAEPEPEPEPEPEVNLTEEEPEPEPEPEVDSGLLTGLAVVKDKLGVKNIIYAIIGIIVLAVALTLLFMRKKIFKPSTKTNTDAEVEPKSVKLSELKKQQAEGKKPMSEAEELKDAESRLQEAAETMKAAKAELDDIKNKDSKITDAQKKFEAAKAELEKAKAEQQGQ